MVRTRSTQPTNTKQREDKTQWQLKLREQDLAIARLHVDQLERQLAHASWQIQWYERAPFSWMLKHSFLSLNRAISTRLSQRRHKVLRLTGAPLSATSSLSELAESYKQGIDYIEQGPPRLLVPLLAAGFLGYRVLHKAAKSALRLVRGSR